MQKSLVFRLTLHLIRVSKVNMNYRSIMHFRRVKEGVHLLPAFMKYYPNLCPRVDVTLDPEARLYACLWTIEELKIQTDFSIRACVFEQIYFY